MTIKAKLLAAFGIVLTLMAVLAAVATLRFANFNDALHHIVDVSIETVRLPLTMEVEIEAMAAAQAQMVMANDETTVKKAHDYIAEHLSVLRGLRAELNGVASADDAKDLAEFDAAFAPFAELERQIAKLALDANEQRAREVSSGSAAKAYDDLHVQLDQIVATSTSTQIAALERFGERLVDLRLAELKLLLLKPAESEATFLNYEQTRARAQAAVRALRVSSADLQTLTTGLDAYVSQADLVEVAIQSGSRTKALDLVTGPATNALSDAKSALIRIVSRNTALMNAEKVQTADLYARSRMIVLGTTAATLLVGAIAAFWISIMISRGLRRAAEIAEEVALGNPNVDCSWSSRDEIGVLMGAMGSMNSKLSNMAQAADKIAGGDLTVEVHPRSVSDQLGLSLQRMVAKLREVLSEVVLNASDVASSAKQVSGTSEKLSEGSTQQAAAAEQASAAMEEMSANIRHSTDNAEQTERIATQASDEARESAEAVAKAVHAMKTIAQKTSIVQEIARQTDLLALNAAVEAARAGNHGKGFAVVASEVRKLAERSQTAAAEIGELSSETLDVSEVAGQKLTDLVPSIQKTADLVREISAATREQSLGAEQINTAIRDLDAVIQQNASSATEAAGVSRNLADQSTALRVSVSQYELGNGAAPTPAATTASKPKTVAKSRKAEPPKEDTKPAKPRHGATESGGYALDLWSEDIPDSEFEPMPKAS